jgi:hypothetical protein
MCEFREECDCAAYILSRSCTLTCFIMSIVVD